MGNLIEQHIPAGPQLAGISGFAQDLRRRIAATVTKGREVDFDQRQAVEEGQHNAGIFAGLDAYGCSVRLVQE